MAFEVQLPKCLWTVMSKVQKVIVVYNVQREHALVISQVMMDRGHLPGKESGKYQSRRSSNKWPKH